MRGVVRISLSAKLRRIAQPTVLCPDSEILLKAGKKGGSEALVKQVPNPITSEDALDFLGVSCVEVWSADLFTNGREPLCH